MPYNGSGQYVLPVTSFSPAVGNTTIAPAAQNTLMADLAAALSTVITKDGQTTITANLPMGGYKHTGVANASVKTDYASAASIVDNTILYAGASSAGTDSYVVSLPVSPVSYAVGQIFSFNADVANTKACTINFNGIGATSIKLSNGNDPESGDIQVGPVQVFYNGTDFILISNTENKEIITLSSAASTIVSSGIDFIPGRSIEIIYDLLGVTAAANISIVINGDTTTANYNQSSLTDGFFAASTSRAIDNVDTSDRFIMKMTLSPNTTTNETMVDLSIRKWNVSTLQMAMKDMGFRYSVTSTITSVGIAEAFGNSYLATGSTMKIIS